MRLEEYDVDSDWDEDTDLEASNYETSDFEASDFEDSDFEDSDPRYRGLTYKAAKYQKKRMGTMPIYFVALASMSLMLLLILFFVVNKPNSKQSQPVQEQALTAYEQSINNTESLHHQQSELQSSIEELVGNSGLTAQDLDIWDDSRDNLIATTSANEILQEEDEEGEEDPSTDGLHTRIVHTNGEEEWVPINPYLPRNTYDYAGLVCENSIMKYYENNMRISFLGADLSKNQDYVDFIALHRAGVDYVMLRLGQRGYQTGELSIDDYFFDNMNRAKGAGLDVGVYFFSQATTLEEAEEEAEFVIEALKDYEIDYPVVYATGYVTREVTRAESLDKMTRTNLAIRFMSKIEEAGYSTMLYGTKEWLIQKYSLGSLQGTDLWLAQYEDIPDFPYEFSMWQYTDHGRIDGIAGNANLSISFVDYSLR